MQPLEDIFSSPEKTGPVNLNRARTPSVSGAQYSENEHDDSDDMPMDIENSMSASGALYSSFPCFFLLFRSLR